MKIVNKNFVVQDFVRKRKRTLPYNVYITHYVLDCKFKILADSKILSFQNPEFKILADFKISAFQNPEVKILAFQDPELKILADFKTLAFQNP